MIEITFREFFEYTYRLDEKFYQLYVMKNGLGETLYVGISRDNIWNRWFGPRGHIMVLEDRYMSGESSVGCKIVDHLPDSWEWKIQLWTLEDCKAFCADELNLDGKYGMTWLEPIMIQKLRPSLNMLCNLDPGPDHTPESEREKKRKAELDRVYHEVFEKKSKWKTE